MAIFTPTVFYFGQPVTAAGGYIIRPDAFASSVTYAVPGTQFGSTFSQTSFRSDISGFINGGSSIPDLPITGSAVSSVATSNFTDYATAINKPGLGNVGALAGTTSNIDFGSGAYTIECWLRVPTTMNNTQPFWSYNNGSGFSSYGSGYWRWLSQNSTAGEALRDFTTTVATNTWYHWAQCRSGNTIYGCWNGNIRANFTLAGSAGTTAPFQIMGLDGNTATNTYFQDFRITKGVARYTGALNAAYTVPQSIVMNS